MHITTRISGVGYGVQYTVTLVGGTTGTFTEQSGAGAPTVGSGSYTYTVDGTRAHLYMVYKEFPGDYDDMMLTFEASAGSPTPSSFSGTQRVGGAVYQFTGTFTYSASQ
jgi:hypothetical protein